MKIYVPADGEMCNVHHDLDCCGRKFNRPDPHTKGIAEGLRMAAEMFRESQWKAFKNGVPIHWFDFYQEIIAKAREVEEAKGDK